MAEYSVVIPQLQHAELSAKGFSSEVMEYLAKNGVTKDAVVLEMEKFPGATLEAVIGELASDKAEAPGTVEAGSPEAEAVLAEQAAPVVEAQESPVSEVAAE